ncbi:MAG: hypothetical protein KIT14_00220 [bacterium]|nr:hypothetical protein [bacterium]
MQRGIGRFALAAALAAGTALVAAPALAQPAGVTKNEVKCESGTGKTLSKLAGALGKCAQKCLATARKTSGPYTECFPPYTGAMAACVNDPVKGATTKAAAGIVKACTADCPECYPASVCTSGQPFVNNTSGLLGTFGTLVYCMEAAGQSPSKDQAKCADGASKTLAKFAASKSKCYDKCQQSVFSGKLPEGSCNPPTPTHAATAACILKAEQKSVATIDKGCAVAKPTCWDGVVIPNSGTGWTALAEAAVDIQVPIIGCGSPSGAFLD